MTGIISNFYSTVSNMASFASEISPEAQIGMVAISYGLELFSLKAREHDQKNCTCRVNASKTFPLFRVLSRTNLLALYFGFATFAATTRGSHFDKEGNLNWYRRNLNVIGILLDGAVKLANTVATYRFASQSYGVGFGAAAGLLMGGLSAYTANQGLGMRFYDYSRP